VGRTVGNHLAHHDARRDAGRSEAAAERRRLLVQDARVVHTQAARRWASVGDDAFEGFRRNIILRQAHGDLAPAALAGYFQFHLRPRELSGDGEKQLVHIVQTFAADRQDGIPVREPGPSRGGTFKDLSAPPLQPALSRTSVCSSVWNWCNGLVRVRSSSGCPRGPTTPRLSSVCGGWEAALRRKLLTMPHDALGWPSRNPAAKGFA